MTAFVWYVDHFCLGTMVPNILFGKGDLKTRTCGQDKWVPCMGGFKQVATARC